MRLGGGMILAEPSFLKQCFRLAGRRRGASLGGDIFVGPEREIGFMCGIAGGWSEKPVGEDALAASLQTLVHRGPDESGVFRSGPAFLGARRLAIIDPESGHQPMASHDKSVVVVCNGEIYNYIELQQDLRERGHQFRTKSDTEVLLHLYEEFGMEMCAHLRGMFAFAIYAAREPALFLARDRFGQKPLYYTYDADVGLVFASELKALRPLMRTLDMPLTVAPQAIYDYLSLGAVPQPTTIYQDVFALEPASWLRFDGEKVATGKYWELQYEPKEKLSDVDAAQQLRELVREAVRLRLRSDAPLGVFLSGGVDSAVVAYEAAQVVGDSLQTFTVSLADEQLDEAPRAARTAKHLGVGNQTLPLKIVPVEELQRLVRHYDQPYADSSAIPSLAVSRLAREHVKVILNGDGGDEVFAGYRRHVAAEWSGRFSWLPAGVARGMGSICTALARRRRSALGFAGRFYRGLALPGGAGGGRHLVWSYDLLLEEDKRAIWMGEPQRPTEEMVGEMLTPGLSALDTQLSGDVRLSLLSDFLVKMDMATMAASLEARSPLLDHEVAGFAARLESRMRIRQGVPKYILREAYRDVLPQEVVRGKKRGFEVPLRQWLENDLSGLIQDSLLAPDARLSAYVKPAFVRDLLAGKVLRERNWAYLVYALLTLELWLREE